MLNQDEEARIAAERIAQDVARENQELIEAQACLRFVKYGILPEGDYDWYRKPKLHQGQSNR